MASRANPRQPRANYDYIHVLHISLRTLQLTTGDGLLTSAIYYSNNPIYHSLRALVAQLDRASDFESEGRRFEPCRVHQKSQSFRKSVLNMSPIEIRTNPNYKWQVAAIAFIAMSLLYFYLGYLPVMVWVLGGLLVVALLYKVVRGESKDPCIVLDDKGVFDSRLRVGVISWDDIREIKFYDRDGTQYISLELHDAQKYQARQPSWMKLISIVHRVHGMSATSITTNGLNMDRDTLAQKIEEGCERASRRTVAVE